MSKSVKIPANGRPRQGSIFDAGVSAPEPGRGDLCVKAELREWLGRAIARASISREMIAARVSELMDRELTLSILNTYTAASKEQQHHIPADALPALCRVLGDFEGLEILCRAVGGRFVAGEELREFKLLRLREERERIEARIAAEEEALGMTRPKAARRGR